MANQPRQDYTMSAARRGESIVTTFETTTPLLSGRSGIGLSQRRKVFEMRNEYTLTGEDGEAIGAVEQVDQSAFTFLARLISVARPADRSAH